MTLGLNGKCTVCYRTYECGTDGNGGVWFAHPKLPCEAPRPNPRFEWIPCKICRKKFDPVPRRGGPFRKVCPDPVCQRAHDTKEQAARRARYGQKYVRKDLREQYLAKEQERLAALIAAAHAQLDT